MNAKTPSTFGEQLRTFRKRSRLTQRRLATLLGVHINTIGIWERGEGLPERRGNVLELARWLRLDEYESRLFLEASLTALSPHWCVPFRRNPLFTGREQLLETLHHHLGVDQVIARSYAIYGLGGVGKTHLAVEYAYRHALEYAAIFWISAENTETILSSLRAIAEQLQLPGLQEADQQRVLAAVQSWLKGHGKWLLIWDNLEEVDLFRHYLPLTTQGTVLITTRRQGLGVLAQSLELPTMAREEGMLLLLRRAKLLTAEANVEDMKQQIERRPAEYQAAQEVVMTLGGLPLALDQAGAYIEVTRCSVCDYASLLRSSQLRLLEEYDLPGDHPLSVVKTFALVFEQLEQNNPWAVEIVTVCAFLAPEAIPEAIFLEGAAYLGASFTRLSADPFAFQAALKALLSSSLIQRDASTHTLSIHRLVQMVIKGRLSPDAWQRWAGCVIKTIAYLFPFDEAMQADYWPVCEQLLSHAQMCLSLCDQYDGDEASCVPLLSRVATYLYKRARYTEAEQLFKRAEQIGKRALDAQHPLLAEALHGLGELYREQGKYEQAEPLYQQALGIWEKALGADHPQVASPLTSLGILYRKQGKYEQAEPLYQRALRVREQALGVDHPQVASPLTSLGELYREQGKYEQAEPLYQRALRIREQALGADHPQVASPLNNLGILYHQQGRYEQAEPLYQRALDIWEQALGADHPQVALPLNNLGELYREQGKYEQAEPLYQRALRIREQTLGADHSLLAAPLISLGELYREQGKYEQAEPLYQQALRIREQVWGSDHSLVAFPLNDLGMLYHQQERYEQAEPLYQRALYIWEQAWGPDHPQVAYPLNNLGELYFQQGRYEQAESLYQRALCIWEQGLGSEHPVLAEPLNGLANLYREQDQYEQAEPLYQRALLLRQQHLGLHHPETASTLHDLAQSYAKQGNYEQAKSLFQRACSIFEQRLGPEHPDAIKAKANYQRLLEQESALRETIKGTQREHIEVWPGSVAQQSAFQKAAEDTSAITRQTIDPFTDFLATRCELHPRAWCRSADIWRAYERWVEEQRERYPLSRGAFNAQLKAHGCRADRTRTARIWRGLTLVTREG